MRFTLIYLVPFHSTNAFVIVSISNMSLCGQTLIQFAWIESNYTNNKIK